MKKKIGITRTVIMLFGILFLSEMGKAQLPEIANFKLGGVPSFYYDLITMAADSGKTQLNVFIKVAFDELQFAQQGEQYVAKYEISGILLDKQGNQVDGILKTIDISVDDFKQTNSPDDFSFSQFKIILPPGKYELRVAIMDSDSKKTRTHKMDVNLTDYNERPLDVSTLLFVDEIVTDSSGQDVIVPNVLKNYGDSQKSLYVWYEIYNRLERDSLYMSYKIVDRKEKIIRKGGYYIKLKGMRTVDTLTLLRGDLESGRYKLVLELGEDEYAVRQENGFTIQWLKMPAFTSDIDMAIRQLKYIAKSGEIRKMRKAEDDEKEELFLEFWKERDPTPGTARNELMDEYFRRIHYSNAAFSSLIKGWQSDRGMIYVIFGPPDEVERHPFAPDVKPYEVWAYYEFGRAFVFIDETGFGDYRLTPAGWRIMNEYR